MKVRDAFFDEVYKNVKQGEDFVIVSSDIGAPSLDSFRKDFPQRFVNVGIAEQNAISVAAGLQLAGKKVITYGLNPFLVTRAFDQIRNVMASQRIPITVTALNAGTCSADAGYSHMAIENLSLVRSLKNIQIINPSDETMARSLVEEILKDKRPRYVQFDKYIDGSYYAKECLDYSKGFTTTGGKQDTIIVSYGFLSQEMRKKNHNIKIIDCFSLPIDEIAFVQEINEGRRVIVIEDSICSGGIGSMVLEVANKYRITIPIEINALRFEEGYPQKYTNRALIFKDEFGHINSELNMT